MKEFLFSFEYVKKSEEEFTKDAHLPVFDSKLYVLKEPSLKLTVDCNRSDQVFQ